MGHYRSEMGYENEDEKKARLKAQAREATAKRVREFIEVEGIEYILADILADPLMAGIKYRRHE